MPPGHFLLPESNGMRSHKHSTCPYMQCMGKFVYMRETFQGSVFDESDLIAKPLMGIAIGTGIFTHTHTQLKPFRTN